MPDEKPNLSRRRVMLAGAAAAMVGLSGEPGGSAGANQLELVLPDLPDGKPGPAVETVDVWRYIGITQSTPNVTITLPASNRTKPFAVTISNRGTVPFGLLGVGIDPGAGRTANWTGRRWQLAGAPYIPERALRVWFIAGDVTVPVGDVDWVVVQGVTPLPPVALTLVRPAATATQRSVTVKQAGVAPVRLVAPSDDVIDGEPERTLLHAAWSAVQVTYVGSGGWLLS